MSPQPQNDQQDVNETIVTITVTIGELNAFFGVINASAFQAVMRPIVESLSNQVKNLQLPMRPNQAELAAVQVNLTIKIGELNSIFNVINASSGFSFIMKPILDRITSQIQQSMNSTQQLSDAEQMLQSLQGLNKQ